MTTIFYDIRNLLTLAGVAQKDGRKVKTSDLSIIENAVLVVKGGKVAWVGSKKDFTSIKGKKVSLKGADVLPSFTECHTHLIFAGDRQNEFELRNQGQSYEAIAKAGGGILSTVKATRSASEKELKKISIARVADFTRQGVTTLEIKSGYGLNFETELKILKTAKSLKGPRIVTTFMGPHALPAEAKSKSEYINEVISWMPKLKKYSDRADIFIDRGFFELADANAYFSEAKRLGFQITAHTDQISHTGSSVELSKMGAMSVDHAIQVTENDISRLAQSQSTVVLLPTSDFYLKINYPPARALIDQGARVALATDFNPGTAPSQDLSLVGVLARLQMKMSLPEVIASYTYNSASALGLKSVLGSLEKGKNADFIVLNDSWSKLFYQVGHHPIESTWRSGKLLKS